MLGGIDGKKVLCTLGEGSVFGEIALLGVGGMNKRTADVVSVGYSNLFVLKKEDLERVLEDYPDAKRILNARYARSSKCFSNSALVSHAAPTSKPNFGKKLERKNRGVYFERTQVC